MERLLCFRLSSVRHLCILDDWERLCEVRVIRDDDSIVKSAHMRIPHPVNPKTHIRALFIAR